jgi:hypothetical protein
MKVMSVILSLSALALGPSLAPTSASAGTFYGVPFYGTYATHLYGANRFYEVGDRFRY